MSSVGQRQKEERASKASRLSQTTAREASGISNELISAIFNCLDSDPQRSNLAIIMAAENFSLRDVIKYGLISLGYSMDPDLYRLAEELPFHHWTSLVVSPALLNVDLETIIRAGVKTLVCLRGPQAWSGDLSQLALSKGEGCLLGPLHILGNPTFTIRTGFFTASLANCRLLGLAPHTIMNHDAMSPFVQKIHSPPDPKNGILQQLQSRDFNHDMRPTLGQLTIPHHPYLDIIPWPSFRARAIVASSTDPPLIDKNELCLDLLSDGIYCCSNRGVSLHSRGEGTPWDSRSWEAKPWFLQKWSFLVEGSDIQITSSWWRSRS